MLLGVVACILIGTMGTRWLTLHAIEKLNAGLGPGAYTVTFSHHDVVRLLTGDLGDVHVHGEGVALKNAPRVASMDIDMIHVKATQHVIEAVDSIDYRVRLSADDVNAFLQTRPRMELLPFLIMRPNQVELHARERFLHMTIPGLMLRGSLQVKQRVAVSFVPEAAQLGTVHAGQAGLALLGGAIKPVLNVTTLPYGVTISSLHVSVDAIELTGQAHPPLPLRLDRRN